MSTAQGSLFDAPRRARRVAFDIEIAEIIELAPGDDLERHGPFTIACAATADDLGAVRHWYRRDERGPLGGVLDRVQVRELLESLRAAQRSGAELTAWNGLSFDLRWLGVAAEAPELAAEIALDLVDPMFQLVVQRGFPVKLSSVADAFAIPETKLMDGADAPKEWAQGNYQRVLDYVAGDCRITARVAAEIERTRELRWRTKKGTIAAEPFAKLERVRDLISRPLPDTSWMSEPIPREKFYAWLDATRVAR